MQQKLFHVCMHVEGENLQIVYSYCFVLWVANSVILVCIGNI